MSEANCNVPFLDPTRLAGPNRIQDASLPKSFYQNHFIKIIYQKHVEAFSFSNICGSDFNLGQAHKHLQIQFNSFTKYAFNQKWHFMSFTTLYPKPYSDIGTKTISELNSFCLQNHVMLKNGENACDGGYSMNFLNDSELLDLGSAFNNYQSLGNYTLIKSIR